MKALKRPAEDGKVEYRNILIDNGLHQNLKELKINWNKVKREWDDNYIEEEGDKALFSIPVFGKDYTELLTNESKLFIRNGRCFLHFLCNKEIIGIPHIAYQCTIPNNGTLVRLKMMGVFINANPNIDTAILSIEKQLDNA